jgi:hypothetical protein
VNSDAGESPRSKNTTFRTWQKFEIKNIWLVDTGYIHVVVYVMAVCCLSGGANVLLKIFLLATLHTATAQNIHSDPICPGFMGFKELSASVPQNLVWHTKCPWVLPSRKNTFLNV